MASRTRRALIFRLTMGEHRGRLMNCGLALVLSLKNTLL